MCSEARQAVAATHWRGAILALALSLAGALGVVSGAQAAGAEQPINNVRKLLAELKAGPAAKDIARIAREVGPFVDEARQSEAGKADLETMRDLLDAMRAQTEKRLQLEGEIAETLGRRKKRKVTVGETGERSEDGTAELREIDHRIAHGQYREAESLLRGVIERTPANYRAKLRLAEIYYIDERQADFLVLAEELMREHRADIGDDGWQRVVRMGKVLAPDAPMFSGPTAVDRQA